MYDSLKDKQVDDALLKLEEKREPYTKAQQLGAGRMKPKKESTFGKRPSKGAFGKKNYDWNKKGKNLKPKIKKNDIVDDKYSKWLGTQPCVITGIIAQRGTGADNIHCHHIFGRTPTRNDYLQVPLMGYIHSWGFASYHSSTKADFIKHHKLMVDDIIEFFEDMADHYREKYLEEYQDISKNS